MPSLEKSNDYLNTRAESYRGASNECRGAPGVDVGGPRSGIGSRSGSRSNPVISFENVRKNTTKHMFNNHVLILWGVVFPNFCPLGPGIHLF